jgi:hypothetical protein
MKLSYFVIEKGLPPIPEPKEDNATVDSTQSSSKEPTSSKSSASQGLSFSSSSKPSIKSNKRKLDELRDGVMKASSDDKPKSKNSLKGGGGSASVKKVKKSNKTQLLSFGDDT